MTPEIVSVKGPVHRSTLLVISSGVGGFVVSRVLRQLLLCLAWAGFWQQEKPESDIVIRRRVD